MALWHRNVGHRATYHLDRADWVQSGRAVCGAVILHPAYVSGSIVEAQRTGHRVCKRCICTVEARIAAVQAGTARKRE